MPARTLAAFSVFLFAAGVAAQPAPEPVRFDGHKVVRVQITSDEDLRLMRVFSPDTWSHGEGIGPVDYRVPAEALEAMDGAGLRYHVWIEDVQALIDAEAARIARHNALRGPGWFEEYKTYAEISAYVDALAALRPDLASRVTVGASLEGREIFGISITGPGGGEKPVILLNSLQHAREWVTGMSNMFIADRLVTAYDSDSGVRALVDRFEFVVVPVVNPDGYVYTWSTNRLWRKNRRPNAGGSFGVDPNRNWGYLWGFDNNGSSPNPGSETYRGTGPFSEPCTAAMRDFIVARPTTLAHIDIHSFSQLILSPWGYTPAPPPDGGLFADLNAGMEAAMESPFGSEFVGGPIYTTIYPTNGGSNDWTYGARDILGWGYELRDRGEFGFILPADQIIPSAEEAYAGVAWLAEWLRVNPIRIGFAGGGNRAPTLVVAGETTSFEVEIGRGYTEALAGSGRLFARVGDSGSFAQSPLFPLGGELYRATLPAGACDGEHGVVQFYLTGQSVDGMTVTFPAAGASGPLTATVVEDLAVVADGFEVPSGWTVGAPGDNATAGIWERADPVGTSAQPNDDHTPAPGTIAFITGQHPGGGAGANDVDNGRTTLLSPVFDLSPDAETEISYWRWYSNSRGGAPNQDVFTVDISNDGGETWVNVETVGPDGPETDGGWVFHAFDPAGFVVPASAVQLRFVAADEGAGSLVEAAVDDFSLVSVTPCPPGPACPPDWDGDGVVNSNDYFAFLDDFFGGDADFDGDGGTDSDDYFAFLGAFFEGC